MSGFNKSYSSRVDLGVGVLENTYSPKPVPTDSESLNVYLDLEFKALGARLNGVLGGSVFPIVSEVPKRNKEGVALLFKDKVLDDKGNIIIPSSGLYIYFEGRWNKIQMTAV